AHDILAPSEPAAITIAASDVTLDLDTHTITGPGIAADQPTQAIHAPSHLDLHNITIRNGSIRQFSAGAVAMPAATNLTITNLLVESIADTAIEVGDESTVQDNTLRDIRIDDNTRTATL